MEKGYIHIYTGDGKGKTTAAFGLAVRALCAGKSVYIGQFVKSMQYNETRVTEKFDRIRIEQFGNGCMLTREAVEDDVRMAHEGLVRCKEILLSDEYDLVILDELTIALFLGLLESDEVLNLLRSKRPETEVVVTGRYASQELIDIADLVTDMREVKHYYTQGVLARDGIDRCSLLICNGNVVHAEISGSVYPHSFSVRACHIKIESMYFAQWS